MVEKNNVKPGISRYFHLRLVERVGKMLTVIRRGLLPVVRHIDEVKAEGTVDWQGCGAVRRLMMPAEGCDYGRQAAHALKTVLDGSKGRAAAKLSEDVAAVMKLRTTALVLSQGLVQQMLADSSDVIAACKRRMKSAVKAKAKAPARTPQPVPRSESSASKSEAVAVSAVATAAAVIPAVPAVAEEAALSQVQRSESQQSLASSSSAAESEADDCAADGSASEVDSRGDVSTDDSDDETSAATTDPFGFSPQPWEDEMEEDIEETEEGTVGEY